ncbi:NAD(P)-binding protein [Xylariomycetidae sp. FL0641]|nr:NAD(P)-binding protein [Xylariomycetidae sp. FL0641]
MSATTHPEFHKDTEAKEVAAAFADRIRGKTVLVTGVNRKGIGFAAAEGFASQSPATIIVTGRTLSKLEDSIAALRAAYPDVAYRALVLDLSSQRAVRAAAAEVLSWADVPRIDYVIASAGVMAGGEERRLGADGLELHLATNHLGHWLLTCLLAPKLLAAAAQYAPADRGNVRVVYVSSGSPYLARMRWSDMNFGTPNQDLPAAEQPPFEFLERWGHTDVRARAYAGVDAYNRSKVANVLCGVGVTRRLFARHGILGLAVHPGVIPTELSRDLAPAIVTSVEGLRKAGLWSYKSLQAGAATQLVAALDPGLTRPEPRDGKDNYGAFLDDCQITHKCDPLAVADAEADRLWKWSEEQVGEKFEW